jgi:hypothetical protein
MSIMDMQDKGSAGEEPAAPAEPVEAEAPVAAAPEPQEPVAIPVPAPRLSRAAQAAERTRTEITEMRRTLDEMRSSKDQELGRLRTELAMRPVVVPQQYPQQQQAPQAAAPEPDEYFRASRKALDARDFDEYERLQRAGYRAETERMVRQYAPAPQQQQQAADPILAATLARYPDVTNAGQAGINLAIAEDNRLAAMGHPAGYQRFNAALSAATSTIQGATKQSGPTYDRASAAVLGSSPTGRGNGANGSGRGTPSLMLDSPDQERTMRAIAKKSGMTWDEYVSDLATHHPEMLRR